MAKKHWIYIKRGLSEDAKHRAQMGQCIWLYMHIIDRADWETGIAYDWKDREEAADMSIPFETLRDQRQKLEKSDYIRCIQKQHSIDIKIMEWRNPRDYGTEVKNPRIEGDGLPPPSDFQSDGQGDGQGSREIVTPTSDSNSESNSLSEKEKQQANDKVDAILGMTKGQEGYWQGRELIRADLLPLADWYNSASNQVMTKRVQKAWWKALTEWKDEGLEPKHLQAAYDNRIQWKKIVADPNELTKDAVAIKAAGNAKQDEYQRLPETPLQRIAREEREKAEA